MHPLLLTSFLSVLSVPGPVVSWTFEAKEMENGTVAVELTATAEDGWHIYATHLENDLGPIPTSIRFEPSDSYSLDGALQEPEPVDVFDPNFEMQVQYHSGSPRFVQLITPRAKGSFTVKGEVEFMVCNDKTCLPPEVVTFSLDVPMIKAKPQK